MEFLSPLIAVRHASEAGWDVPEANIGVLGLQTQTQLLHTLKKTVQIVKH